MRDASRPDHTRVPGEHGQLGAHDFQTERQKSARGQAQKRQPFDRVRRYRLHAGRRGGSGVSGGGLGRAASSAARARDGLAVRGQRQLERVHQVLRPYLEKRNKKRGNVKTTVKKIK